MNLFVCIRRHSLFAIVKYIMWNFCFVFGGEMNQDQLQNKQTPASLLHCLFFFAEQAIVFLGQDLDLDRFPIKSHLSPSEPFPPDCQVALEARRSPANLNKRLGSCPQPELD